MATPCKEDQWYHIQQYLDRKSKIGDKPYYEEWLGEWVNRKPKRKKIEVDTEYGEAWEKFWDLWPATKSVPDDKGGWLFKSSAVMKSDEAAMYKKWLKAVTSKECTITDMYRAAKCYLLYGYNKSKALGQNKMEYEKGMSPWLNQECWKVYMNLEMPQEYKQTKIADQYTEA